MGISHSKKIVYTLRYKKPTTSQNKLIYLTILLFSKDIKSKNLIYLVFKLY